MLLAGGWAIDLFVGRPTRKHADVDLAVWRADQERVRESFPDWRFDVADEGVPRPWNPNEWLALPIHEIHARAASGVGQTIELLLNEGTDAEWIHRRDSAVRLPMAEAIRFRDGTPYLAPEIVLLFKSKAPKANDEADLEAALPMMSRSARGWLASAIARASSDHPWLSKLAARRHPHP